MNKFLLGIVSTIVVVGIVGTAYYWGTQQKTLSIQSPSVTPQPQVQTTITVQPTNAPTVTNPPQGTSDFVNPSATIANIEASVKSKNYAALEGYMAPSVSVTLAASECCGTLSPAKATAQLSYLNNGIEPWDFTDTNPIATKLRTADPTNFKDAIIGTASNKFAVGFTLNNKYLINKIFMVIDYKLIAP